MESIEIGTLLPLLGVSGLFVASFVFSTLVIRLLIPLLDDGSEGTSAARRDSGFIGVPLPESSSTAVFDLRSTGFWIGFCETLLIFVLVYAGAFSALAIIIGAKQFVRNEKIKERPSYYLLGTLANLALAVLFALVSTAIWPSPMP
ncbi:MAG: hypothetical protein AAF253_06350 [Pseudomonadota bacterium]